MGRPRPRTRPPDPGTGRAYRPARSAPFYRCIRVDDRDRAMLAPARDYPGLAPRAAPLPALARRVQGAPDRVGADTREAVLRLAQGAAQRAQGPRRRAITGPVRSPLGLGQNAPLLLRGIADRRPAPMVRHHRCETFAIE